MGELLSKVVDKIANSFGTTKPTKILLLGLDGAGKTTTLYRLKLKKFVNTIPTIGFNVENIDYKNLRMTVWDIKGQNNVRELWKHYYSDTDALIFIINSHDEKRFELAKEELYKLLAAEELRDIPVLVYANKQDIGKITPEIMLTKLELGKFKNPWKVQGTCAKSGEGLYEGLDWLSKEIKKRKNG